MAKRKPPEIDPAALVGWANRHADKIVQAHDKFYVQFGKALDAWSVLENCLSHFFAKLTGMTPKKARRIFYSARGFHGRVDMLEAALSATRLSRELHAFLKTAIKTTRTYYNFRNALAHGKMSVHLVGFDNSGLPVLEMFLTEPKYPELMQIGFGISATDLATADDAFRMLAGDLQMALSGEISGPSLEERRQAILMRPKLQHSKAMGPIARKRDSSQI